MGIKMNLFGSKIKGDSLKNLVKILGEDYDVLINKWEESQRKEHFLDAQYFGKVLANSSEKGLNIELYIYSKGYYSYVFAEEMKFFKSKKKIKSLEGTIPYSSLSN